MERQWLNNSVFDVPSWSVYRHDVRTNNDTEGWHHRLNMKAGGIGLLFYRLVPVLRNEAVTAEQNAQLVRDGVAGRRLRKSYQKVQKLLESYGSCMMKMLSQLQNY